MKKIAFILSLVPALVLTGCKFGDAGVPSTGTPYELFVVSQTSLWESVAGDTVRSIFREEVEMLNQSEPIYDVYHVTSAGTRQATINRHRNILRLNVGSEYQKSDMTAEYDTNSQPQLILNVTSPSADSMAAFLHTYRAEIVRLFDIAERDRFMARAERFKDKTIPELLQKKFGISLSVPEGYRVRNELSDFVWISYELPLASIGLVVYTYDADTTGGRQRAAGNIIAARNLAVSQIPGPSDGSYMQTGTMFYPSQRMIDVAGHTWSELRGFWDVFGDFMGGPFLNWTTYDQRTGKMIAIDGYVFSPSPNNRLGKRNYVRQLEAIFRTVKFTN